MKQLDITEKVIFGITILFCVVLHFYNLNLLSGWTDEFASMYFAENLHEVYATETHPPLFYAALTPFMWIFGKDLAMLRLWVSLMSMGLLVWAVFLSQKIFGWRGAALTAVLLVFNPVEIIHSRMVRQYSIFFELTVLLILYSLIENKIKTVFTLSLILSWIHPVGFLPAFSLAAFEIGKSRTINKRVMLYLGSVLPVGIYFSSKIFLLEGNKYLTGYNPGKRGDGLLFSIIKNMAGEHFPKVNFYPPPLEIILFLVLIMMGLVIYSLKKPISNLFWILVSFVVVSISAAELINLVMVDIRFGRYFIYLFAPFIVLAVEKFYDSKKAIPCAFGIGLIFLSYTNPFQFYPGEREILNEMNLEHAVFCANEFQFYYYFNTPEIPCDKQYEGARDQKVDFYFVDFNGHGIPLLKYINREYQIENFQTYGTVSKATATYRNKK